MEQKDAWFAGLDETVNQKDGRKILSALLSTGNFKLALPSVITNQRNFNLF